MTPPTDLSVDTIDRWPPAEVVAWQAGRLGAVLRYAVERAPFYRDLWGRAGVSVEDVASVDDLAHLPVIRKRDLLEAGMAWGAAGEGAVGFSTRGTSGEPLLLWLSATESEAYVVPTVRGFRWAGLRAGMTALLLSPAWHRLAAMEGNAAARLGARPAYAWGSVAGSEDVDRFVEALEALRPGFVTSTPPFLLNTLRRCEETGLEPRALFDGVAAISLVGLPLTPQLQGFLRDRLGVPHVFERGGTQEGAALDECKLHTTPHVHTDVCHLEVLDERGAPVPAGHRGRLVVTKLVAGGSPFVRYDTEDIAGFEPEPCPCGRTAPRLRIFGRAESSVAVDGHVVTAYDVRRCVDEDPNLVGRVVLLIRPTEGTTALRAAMEGRPPSPGELERRLGERFATEDVEVIWLGDARISWGFRQVIGENELQRG